MSKCGKIFGTGISLFLIGLWGLLIFGGYRKLKNAQESPNWPTTDGIIILSKIEETVEPRVQENYKVVQSTIYNANVRYKYTVGEKSYLSERFSFSQYSDTGLEKARSTVRRYKEGLKVRVYFNPAQPDYSVLEPGVGSDNYFFITAARVTAPFFLFAPGALLIYLWFIIPILQQRRNERRTEAIKQIALTLAMRFQEKDKTLQKQDFLRFHGFNDFFSQEIRNIFRKRSADGEVIVFNYEFKEDDNWYNQTVAAFQLPNRNLPEFSLRPKYRFFSIEMVTGVWCKQQDINFESYPEFSQNYLLQGQQKTAIRELFNFDVLKFFSQNPGWWIERKGEWLVIYQLNRQIKLKKLSTFLMQTTQISQLFF